MANKSSPKAAGDPALVTVPPFNQTTTELSFNFSTQLGLEAWIYWHYRNRAFCPDGTFRGLPWLRKHLFSLNTGLSTTRIRHALQPLLYPSHEHSLANTEKISKQIMEENMGNSAPNQHALLSVSQTGGIAIHNTMAGLCTPSLYRSDLLEAAIDSPTPVDTTVDLLSWKMGRANFTNEPDGARVADFDTEDSSSETSSVFSSSNFEGMDFLLPKAGGSNNDGNTQATGALARLQHAPLIDASFISSHGGSLLPQYGLLGSHMEARGAESKLLLNTNVPFSMFVCGVQGSGKSHTTSCILENSLIRSKHLGKLQKPLSALVFNFAQFSGDGVGFTVSEAAFLASTDSRLPGGAHVKKVQVLVSPSNFLRISKLYTRLPNVLVTPFKLNPQDLDIDTMLTLMNVGESEGTPLYMAQVTQILREMSTAGGPFNYRAFKRHLKGKDFNPAQTSMLQMRLGLLESFLDMDGGTVEPHFQPGEITIMDMSCPFVNANTACILFKIGLKRYLQSKTSGKMIVLDEAHKYMLKVPGAKALTETLLQTVRLQRHYGARVIISTQEPTLLTDLIALCSVTVIHRFSSPEWLSAIKRHIPTAAEGREDLMLKIEGLRTGEALVYSPNAVLGRDDSGDLITGTSRFIKVRIRRRITSDGGQSMLAV
ncbi:hypothetical protein HBH77_001730 [Parastagonospora nodorum]|nr:hypothetical protein HBH75_088800 [Parastagonospora nodorum]KAH4967088.1 hypothetical protein HBI78_078230 [Parastagonospora nodorum]KAH5086929.1 hypothetical protein HBH95_001660 [Parastagonospora nodorum]KAH5120571.1 hypothetical protein HBH71_061240 [Parastagonospora nodorum]KAH5229704.1 hypothetical protein HBH77_001730 [Parastagonospora nodorum]